MTNASKKSILIVDDQPEIREIVQELIASKTDIEVRVAASGKEAIHELESRLFDAVVCDFRMPGMSGDELLKAIVSRQMDIPFVILSGFASSETILQMLRLGAFDFLEKPFDDAEFLRTVRSAVEVGARRRHLRERMWSILTSGKAASPTELDELQAEEKSLSLIRMVNSKRAALSPGQG